MGLQRVQLQHLQGRLIGRRQDDRWGHPRLYRFVPARRAEAPPIPGFQPRKIHLGTGRHQVIPFLFRKLQERLRHHGTYYVVPYVAGACLAATISVKPGFGIR